MTVRTFYRLAVWLPLLVPALVALVVQGLGLRGAGGAVDEGVQILLMSGIYGGIPYAALAAWASWWIGGQPESRIRRRALVAPFWMLGAWVTFALLTVLVHRDLRMAAGLAGLGAAVVLPLGYAYVVVVLLLRRLLPPVQGESSRV